MAQNIQNPAVDFFKFDLGNNSAFPVLRDFRIPKKRATDL